MRISQQLLISGSLLGAALLGWYGYQQRNDQQAPRERPARVAVVETTQVKRGTVTETLAAVGSSEAAQSVDILAPETGRITDMKFTPGQQITAGSLLVVLDHDSQTAALQEATSTLQHLQLQWQRAQQLRAKQLISQADADNTESELAVAKARVAVADSQLQKRFVRAPFSGRVGLRRVDIGTVVNASTVLTTLDDLRQIYVGFQVPEQHLRQLKAGQTVLARSPAFANETFRGELAEIDTRVDANTRAFRVRAAFANPQQQLIAGLSMRLELTLAERPQALLVPEEAVLSQDQSRYVFVIHDDQAQRTEVQLGTRMPGQIEILKGLEADQEIVIKGQQNLSDQSRIRRATAAP